MKSDSAVQAVLRGRLVQRDDPSVEIAGTLERLAGVALVGEGALDPLGGIAFDYAGETTIWWDEQRTAERRGQRVFVDEAGHEVLEEAVVILLDDGRVRGALPIGSDPLAPWLGAVLATASSASPACSPRP